MRNVSHTRQESPRLQPWGGSQFDHTKIYPVRAGINRGGDWQTFVYHISTPHTRG